jgi:hypothetical protein
MIISHHKQFTITGIPLEDDAWCPMGYGYVYLNVFDLRSTFGKNYNEFRHDMILKAFKTVYGPLPSKEYVCHLDQHYRQLSVYTHDMDWQVTARLLDVEHYLLEHLEQVVHQVTPQITR